MTVEMLMVAAIAFTGGTIVQVFASGRDIDRECSSAYLYGHVDGYEKAMQDAGVPE